MQAYLDTQAIVLVQVGLERQPLIGEVVVEQKNSGGARDAMKQFLRPLVLVDPFNESSQSVQIFGTSKNSDLADTLIRWTMWISSENTAGSLLHFVNHTVRIH